MLLNDLGSKVDKLLADFGGEIMDVSNGEFFDVLQFLYDSFDHALLKWCL